MSSFVITLCCGQDWAQMKMFKLNWYSVNAGELHRIFSLCVALDIGDATIGSDRIPRPIGTTDTLCLCVCCLSQQPFTWTFHCLRFNIKLINRIKHQLCSTWGKICSFPANVPSRLLIWNRHRKWWFELAVCSNLYTSNKIKIRLCTEVFWHVAFY